MNRRYRLPAPRPGLRGFLPDFFARLRPAERAKRQLDKTYQRRAERRLRESGLVRV